MLRLPSFEYHNKLLSWTEVFLLLKKGSVALYNLQSHGVIDAARVALMNAGSLLKEKIKRLGQSNLSEEEKLNRTPVKAKPSDAVSTDVGLQKVKSAKLNFL